MKVVELTMRGVLDSRAEVTVEADVVLDDGLRRYHGRGSSARAIAPGRRERTQGGGWPTGRLDSATLGLDAIVAAVRGAEADDAASLDARVAGVRDEQGLGTDVSVAVSLAVARARAAAQDSNLTDEIAQRAGTRPRTPRILVNVFSGGIHASGHPHGFQQMMAVPRTSDVRDAVASATRVWAAAAALAHDHTGAIPLLSASSGMVLDEPSGVALDLIDAAIEAAGETGRVDTGVDVAAEHLSTGDGRYRLDGLPEGDTTDAVGIAAVVTDRALRGSLTYIEDPFDPSEDPARWIEVTDLLRGHATVVGDDLFVSDATRVEPQLAGALLLKPSQAGTLTELLRAAAAARAGGMALVVSHRSGETEDTAVCDLAVALGAEFLKLGGPRRGDRIAKYNQLLRISEQLTGPPTPTTVGQQERTTP